MPHKTPCAHGSEHLLFVQARVRAHSLFETHSGRQFGGEPK